MERQWSFQYSKPTPPNGPVVELTVEEVERLLLKKLEEERSDPVKALWELAWFYSRAKQPEKALEYLRRALERMEGAEAKAEGILALGQVMEQLRNFPGAIRFYKEAFSLEPAKTRTWYLIHNNLGFCLNELGRFAEGEPYCRKAMEIDGNRPNAYKNLGISLQGQGSYADAARCFIQATQVNASDRRSYGLLKALLEAHPELEFEHADDLECCRQAVEFAAGEVAKARPVVHRGLKRHVFMLRLKLRALIKRFRGRRR